MEFIEAEACVGGCCGGSLTVENCYSAKTNLKVIIDEAKEKYGNKMINISDDPKKLLRNRPLNYRPVVLQLDEDLNVAIKKMDELGRIVKTLPGVDCGVCGAPNMQSFRRRYSQRTYYRACLYNIESYAREVNHENT